MKASKPYFLAFILLLLHSIGTYAQDADTTRIIVEDGWIEKMSKNISIDISFNNSYKTFEVKTPDTRILLYPNTPNSLKMKFSYEFISFGFQFSPGFLPGNGEKNLKGSTKSFQIGSTFIFRHWFVGAAYSKVRGYYLKNTNEYIPWTSGDPYIQFPDLNYQGISISSGFIQNPKFSFRSLTSQTERQLKSAGCFVPVINFDYYVVDDKSPSLSTQTSHNTQFNIGPAYAYTFVHKQKFYASLGLYANVGYLNTRLTTRTSTGSVYSKQDNFIFRWDAKAGMGYNGPKYYGGAYASLAGTHHNQENTTAYNTETRVFYHIFFGMRFKAPKFMAKKVDEMKSYIP